MIDFEIEMEQVAKEVAPPMQEKEVIPTEEQQIVLPEENFGGLSKVIVQPIPSEYVIATVENETLMLRGSSVVEEELVL